jgi:DNA-binding CsgD family transcriptional regulator
VVVGPEFGPDGVARSAILSARDITGRIQNARRARFLDAVHESLAETMPTAAAVVTGDGEIIYANRAFESITGRERGELLRRSFTGLLATPTKPAALTVGTTITEIRSSGDASLVARMSVRRVRIPREARQGDADWVRLVFLTPLAVTDRRRHADESGLLSRLTPRRLEVLERLAAGRSTAAVARELNLAEATVRNHVHGILQALRCHSRVEAVAIYMKHRLPE